MTRERRRALICSFTRVVGPPQEMMLPPPATLPPLNHHVPVDTSPPICMDFLNERLHINM